MLNEFTVWLLSLIPMFLILGMIVLILILHTFRS